MLAKLAAQDRCATNVTTQLLQEGEHGPQGTSGRSGTKGKKKKSTSETNDSFHNPENVAARSADSQEGSRQRSGNELPVNFSGGCCSYCASWKGIVLWGRIAGREDSQTGLETSRWVTVMSSLSVAAAKGSAIA